MLTGGFLPRHNVRGSKPLSSEQKFERYLVSEPQRHIAELIRDGARDLIAERNALFSGQPRLRGKARQLLEFLLLNRRKPVSRRQIIAYVDGRTVGYADPHDPNRIATWVDEIRRAIGEEAYAPRVLVCIRKNDPDYPELPQGGYVLR